MYNNVIVVPADKLIIVDGSALIFDFEAPENLRAIQWHNGVGHTEYTNATSQTFDASGYADDVAPFVALWTAEKARLEEARATAEVEALAQYNSAEARAERVRAERDCRITACDWIMARHAEEVAMEIGTTLTDSQYSGWLFYRQELRDLTDEVGFPWDGGGDETPWPEEPVAS